MSDSGVVPVSGFLWPLCLGGLIMDVCSYLMGWWGSRAHLDCVCLASEVGAYLVAGGLYVGMPGVFWRVRVCL